jgi:hypothetical protein
LPKQALLYKPRGEEIWAVLGRDGQLMSEQETLLYPEVMMMMVYRPIVALGGLLVACLPLDPRFAGSNPAEDDGFLRVIKILVIKIRRHDFLRRGSEVVGPM